MSNGSREPAPANEIKLPWTWLLKEFAEKEPIGSTQDCVCAEADECFHHIPVGVWTRLQLLLLRTRLPNSACNRCPSQTSMKQGLFQILSLEEGAPLLRQYLHNPHGGQSVSPMGP